jgi:ADP-heptose:LPS heptosyltransferase
MNRQLMKKILLIEPSYLGDILMTTPAIRVLHEHADEQVEIHVLTNNIGQQLLQYNPHVANIILKRNKSFAERLNLINRIQSIKPDQVFLFRTTLFNSVAAALSGAKKTAGVNTELASLFLFGTVDYNVNRNYRLECLQVLEQVYEFRIRLFDELAKTEMYVSKEDESSANSLLETNNIKPGDKIAVVNPGTTRPAKQWLPDRYGKVINRLSELGYKTVITGTAPDSLFINEILKHTTVEVINLVDKTTVRQLASLIKRSHLFISPDTGPMYFASTYGINTITLFGSSDPEKYGPYNKQTHKILYKKLNCSPCYKNYCPLVPKTLPAPCMDDISIGDVITSIF